VARSPASRSVRFGARAPPTIVDGDAVIDLPGPLVSAAWLRAHLAEVHVADVRWYLDGRSGRAAYEAGHLPTAVWVDLDHDLAGPPSSAGGRHPLPDPAAFAEAIGRLGISEDRPVVAYDDAAGSIAARLWWMLRVTGQPAAVLDGGIAAWSDPLEAGPGRSVAVPRVTRSWPAGSVASTEEVATLLDDPTVLLLDARAAARYQGVEEPIDARAGHIPGARNHPWTDNVAADGRFLAAVSLRHRLEGRGATGDRQVVVSCGSGVTACHDLLALEVAGLPGGRLYPGSWSAWAANPELPAVVGPEPG
jgi:thiosulfate/3-mercaptopyruvate sulfurtransferase